MVMPESPEDTDRDGLAAEYALGTLSSGERAIAERLLERDAAFGFEIERWKRRLDPLLDAYQTSAAPLDVLANVLTGIGPAATGGAEIVVLRRSAARWRAGAAAASAIAASLLGFFAVTQLSPRAAPGFFAVLEDSGRVPAFVAAVDVERKQIAVRRIVAEPSFDRSYELWAIRDSDDPQSLGIVDGDTDLTGGKFGGARSGSGILLAVTVEPKGGSPTRRPTTAPLFTGKLVESPAH